MTRNSMASMALLLLGAGLGQTQGPGVPSSDALMAPAAVNQLCGRLGELMEAGGVAVPDLLRAAAPVIENTRQDCIQLRLLPGRGRTTYSLLMNLRSYLALADSVPKPFPFPEAAQKQLTELRDDATRLDAHFRALIENRDRQLASPDPANLSRYADANRKLGPATGGKPRVVFLGDSITDFWRLNEYFPDSGYINRGIAGQLSSHLLQRMKDDVIDLHPQAVLILAGTNDLARAVPLHDIESNYQTLADLAAAYKIKVLFASLTPVSDYHKDQEPSYERTLQRPPAQIKALNEWLQGFCSQRGYAYVDYFTATVDPMGQFQAELSDDGLHPNAKGYRVMAPLAAAAIDKTLAPVETSQKPKKRGIASIVK
ncbi:MAG TPA: GDSL-type esterase/lipase family protein [Bryobacteraceae bacterium]|nr:GDSL-type esterase/lipase family protein [Bryobacteraceae bacterium]